MALADYVWNPRIIQFDQLTNIQETFPPNQHQQNLEQFRKWEGVQEALNNLTEKMGNNAEPTLLFQQQTIFIREAYDALLSQVSDLTGDVHILKERLAVLENRP